MPNPGTVNNPQGHNSLGSETAYGAVKALTDRTAQAPLPANSALAAPRRATRRSQRHGSSPQPETPAPQVDPAAQPLTYQAQVAATWAALAQDHDASDLVRMYAQEAQLGRF